MAKKQKRTLVCFVLDETGSMMSVKSETISGFNEYIKTLRKRKENILFNLTTFNSECVKLVHKEVLMSDVDLLTAKTYLPDNLTPLYDAIGQTIRDVEKRAKKMKCSVLFVIMTDGEENASSEFDRKGIFKLITEKTKAGWTFVYLGANQDAWAVGQDLGMTFGNTMPYKTAEMKKTMRVVAASTVSYLNNTSEQTDRFFDG